MSEHSDEIRRALVLGLDVERNDPALIDAVPDLTERQVNWVSAWLAGEGIGRRTDARPAKDEREKTTSAARVIVGHCPSCRGVLVVLNNYEVWPIVSCPCGWEGATIQVDNRTRYERGGAVIDAYRPAPGA